MYSRTLAALVAATSIGLAAPGTGLGSTAIDAVEKARALLAKGDPKGAVALLERSLPDAGADLGPTIVVLRQAYNRAADQASRSGHPEQADEFRENLLILNRRMRGTTDEPAPTAKASARDRLEETPTRPADGFVAPVSEREAPPPAAVPEPAPSPLFADPAKPPADLPAPGPSKPADLPPPAPVPPARPLPDAEPAPRVDRDAPAPPKPEPVPPGPTDDDLLVAADHAYLAGRYLDACKSYQALAARGKLPPGRKIHWAYCRSIDVVRRIKAKPGSEAEWAEIDREIAEIKRLSPRYWYAEYLRNRASERTRVAARVPKGQTLRGAMPDDEPAPPAQPARAPTPTPSPKPEPSRRARQKAPGAIALARAEVPGPRAITTGVESAGWEDKETANFVIHHADPAVADKIAEAAEATRAAQTRRWTGSPPARDWSPKCEIYVYPDAAVFSQQTGQPPESPGFSTMDANGLAIVGRRINVRADHPGLLGAVLPHELTHVILADLFPAQQIPRWADEGIAVLSEPAPEQEKRLADLDPALVEGGKIFSIEHLMVRDYPEGKHWALYYAQSVSLTRYLVMQGTPGQFIAFLQGTQRNGIEPELRRVYKINGYADLQARWLAYARGAASDRVARQDKDGATRR